jgi:hypothetical protein
MERKWLAEIIFYVTGVLLAVWLFSPFLGNWIVDWSSPTVLEKKMKDTKKFSEEIKLWKESKKKALKDKEVFKEAMPKPYIIEVKWEIDDHSFNQHPKFFFSKIGILWFPNTLLIWFAYPFLWMIWFKFYRKSDLFFHSTSYSYITKTIIVQGAVIIVLIISAVFISSNEVSAKITDKEVITAVKNELRLRLPFGINVFASLVTFFIANFLTYILFCEQYRVTKWVNRVSVLIGKALLAQLLGTCIKVKRNGMVKIKKTSVCTKWFVPYPVRRTYTLSFSEFLFFVRKVLFGNISSHFLKDCKDELVGGLKDKFLSASRMEANFFQGETIPKDLRFLVKKGNKTIVVIQEKPSIRSVTFAPLVLEKEKKSLKTEGRFDYFSDEILNKSSFDLAFPYCVFVVVLDNGKIDRLCAYWSPCEINSLSDRIYKFALPNITDRGDVCLGDNIPCSDSLAKQCKIIIDSFWSGHFSYHDIEVFERAKSNNSQIKSLFDWYEASKDGVNFMCHLNMQHVTYRASDGFGHESYDNLSELINTLCKDEKNDTEKAFYEFVDDVLFNKPLSFKILESNLDLKGTPDMLFELIKEHKEQKERSNQNGSTSKKG